MFGDREHDVCQTTMHKLEGEGVAPALLNVPQDWPHGAFLLSYQMKKESINVSALPWQISLSSGDLA